MATPTQIKRRGRLGLILGCLFAAVTLVSVAYADNIKDDAVASGKDTFTAGGSSPVRFWIQAQQLCDASDGSAATVTINVPAEVTASPSSLTFSQCNTSSEGNPNNTQSVTFSSSTPGDYGITVSVLDSAGSYNTSPASFTLHVLAPPDSTAPVITPTVTGTAGNNDWYTSNVGLSWSVVDAESTISSQSGCGAVNITADQAGTTYTCTATSAGGTASKSVTIKKDATNPTITAAAGTYVSGSWTNETVTVKFTCFDAMSGLLGTCPSDVVVSGDTVVAGQDVSASVSDNAGNSASSNTINVKVDKTAPTISGSRLPLPNAAGWNNTDVVVSFSCGDTLSGQASCGPTPVTVSSNGANQSVLGTAVDNAGNSSTDTVSGISIDKLAATVAYTSASPAANAKGWNNTDVTATFTATDTLSGFAPSGALSVTGTSVASAEGSNVTVGSPAFADLAGNSALAGAASKSFKIDKTPPSVSCDSAPSGWSASNVLIACTASDSISDLADAGDASFNLSTNVADGSETDDASTNSRSVSDNADNSANAGPVNGIRVDRKAPTYACASAPTGWSDADISISCTAADGGSGLNPASDASFSLTTSVAANTETSSASTGSKVLSDEVGNSETVPAFTGLKVDKKAPAISCGSADGQWHSDNVSIACTASDGGSGVAPAGDESFSLSTDVPAGSESNNAATGTKSVADAVGNSATAGPVAGNKVDRKAPVVAPTCPAGPVLLGSNVSGSWSATDGGSGVATGFAAGTIPLNTSSVGSKTMTVPAGASKDNVGNSSIEKTCTYSVVYSWNGFFQPIDNGIVNKAKAGSTVPVKFSLGGDQGLSIFESGYPMSALYTCGDVSSADLIEEYALTGTTSGLKYDPLGNQYIYNWKTDSTWSGKCRQLRVKLADGTMHTANFNFFK